MNEIIERICWDILNKMREDNLRVDDLLPMRWIHLTYKFQLNPEEQKYLVDAIKCLISKGYVVYEKRAIDGLVLTQAGYDVIYRN